MEVLRKENDELKKALGEVTLDIKILKKIGDRSTTKQEVVELANDFAVSINRVIAALGVAKSSVYYKTRPYPERKQTLRKQLPQQVKESIKEITCKIATYGTPRVRAILKRDYDINSSKYMVHRYMKEEGLLLTRFRKRGNSRPHTGKIAVEKPNTRWASDITTIKCWNGQKLRVAFVIDCCDRSIISWKAGLQHRIIGSGGNFPALRRSITSEGSTAILA